MLTFLVFALAAAVDAPLPYEWARFERAGALSHLEETVAIATDGVDPGTHRIEIKLRYTRVTLNGAETLWANSRTCPAIRPMLAGMRDLQMPHPAPYGLDNGDIIVVADGVGYSLHAPSNFSSGELTISSNVGSPLATWVDSAFKALAPCWSKVELHVAPAR